MDYFNVFFLNGRVGGVTDFGWLFIAMAHQVSFLVMKEKQIFDFFLCCILLLRLINTNIYKCSGDQVFSRRWNNENIDFYWLFICWNIEKGVLIWVIFNLRMSYTGSAR